MKRILLFGAGKSASVLIRYLSQLVQQEGWHLTVVDANLEVVQQKLNNAPGTTAASFDITDAKNRMQAIAEADLVISLLPPALHILVARDCITAKKDLLTASYVDGDLKKLAPDIEAAGVLALCEMGLDPGIDHMSAKALIDAIQERGGRITSFVSHCGGLVAPESDDNPWHYKISWNPRNVVLAGKSGALYLQNGASVNLHYRDLFSEPRYTNVNGLQPFCWYPNRDSLPYIELYNLKGCTTFIRTTLRHPDFMAGWKNIIDLQLTDETPMYQSKGKTLRTLFGEHFKKHPLSDRHAGPELKNKFAEQLYFLGLDDVTTVMEKEVCSPADLLQLALEKNLALGDTDKDMVVMKHELQYEEAEKSFNHTSTLVVKGLDSQETAMAKTVGLPLGIAAKLILTGVIRCKGLQIPISREIYRPVLAELQKHGIHFFDEIMQLPMQQNNSL